MTKKQACFVWIGVFALAYPVAHAQSPQQIVQQVVNTEHTADKNDRSRWIYLEEIRKPQQQLLQWVATTPEGEVERVLEKNSQRLPESQQSDLVQKSLQDAGARRKQVAQANHDNRQIDDLLQLLPVAFRWTQTGETAALSRLHFEPAPNFHPPTREARVFSSMTGDLIVDNRQHRIRAMSGHLLHPVVFGGGILGKLKSGSFSLEQEQVAPGLWELTSFHLHFDGNAFLFKSISLQEDDNRSGFEREPSTISLDQAARAVMSRPEVQGTKPAFASRTSTQAIADSRLQSAR